MTYIMTDIEADGPIPGDYSMVSFGAVVVDKQLDKTFYGKLRPISERFVPEALAVTGHSRDETLGFDEPKKVMVDFAEWIRKVSPSQPIFISDNNGFDWMFMCWYFHHFLGRNPFGFSSQNLGSFYKGIVKDTRQNFKHLRRTKHTHNPVDDVIGNAEAMLTMIEKYGLTIRL
jgi:hypothetical protein